MYYKIYRVSHLIEQIDTSQGEVSSLKADKFGFGRCNSLKVTSLTTAFVKHAHWIQSANI